MLSILIALTPGRRNKFIDCERAKVRIAVLPIMDVKTWWNSTLELLKQAYRLREFIREWLQDAKYHHADLANSQRLRKEGNARIIKVSVM